MFYQYTTQIKQLIGSQTNQSTSLALHSEYIAHVNINMELFYTFYVLNYLLKSFLL